MFKVTPHTLRIMCLSLMAITSSSVYSPGNASTYLQIEPKPIGVLFDLGNVLIETNYAHCLWHLGPKDLFKHTAHHILPRSNKARTEFSIRKNFYTVLERIANTVANPYGVHDEYGQPLPLLMCEWLTGQRSNKDLLEIVHGHIQQNKHWFSSRSEQRLMKKMATMLFDPQIFIKTRRLIPEGVALVQECKQRGYSVFVVSNWDQESFELLKNQYPELFNLFDGFFISGAMQMVKPTAEIFEHIKKMQPHFKWVLIDDQEENIVAARHAGIIGIPCRRNNSYFSSKPDFKSVRRTLNRIELIHQKQLLYANNTPQSTSEVALTTASVMNYA